MIFNFRLFKLKVIKFCLEKIDQTSIDVSNFKLINQMIFLNLEGLEFFELFSKNLNNNLREQILSSFITLGSIISVLNLESKINKRIFDKILDMVNDELSKDRKLSKVWNTCDLIVYIFFVDFFIC